MLALGGSECQLLRLAGYGEHPVCPRIVVDRFTETVMVMMPVQSLFTV
jgi:hypothetical protein